VADEPLLLVLARFSRPHTVIATTIQVLSMFVITGGPGVLVPENLWPLSLALASCLCLNLYVVGLNQITDVSIDRVNKPRLPLAAGTLSRRQAGLTVVIAGASALLGASLAGPYLLATTLGILLIGSLYSLPPLRLKRFSFAAALSIALARGLMANLGLALHFEAVLAGPTRLPVLLLAVLTAFFFGFCLVIAICKDLPDTRGDRMHGIQSFALRLGSRRALGLGRIILSCSYAGVMLFALGRLQEPAAAWLLLAQVLALALFWRASLKINLGQPDSIGRFYLLLWCLFYGQYLVLGAFQLAQGLV
jgi:homogentisate phytyltransferase/homogentisate geranylgeranyltransferase